MIIRFILLPCVVVIFVLSLVLGVNATKGFTIDVSTDATEGQSIIYTVVCNDEPSASLALGLSIATSDQSFVSFVSDPTFFFSTSSWSTPQSFTILIADNDIDQNAYSATIEVNSITSSDSEYSSLNKSDFDATFTIQDNDDAMYSMTTTGNDDLDEATTESATLTFVLHTEPTADVVFTFTLTPDPLIYATLDVNSITFTSNDWNQTQSIVVTLIDDEVRTDGFVLEVDMTSGDPFYVENAIFSVDDVTFTVVDNEVVGISLTTDSGSVNEGSTHNFVIVLETKPKVDVVLAILSPDGFFSVTPTSVTFRSSNWDTPVPIVGTAVDDNTYTEIGSVGYSVTSSNDPNYSALNDGNITVPIVDNDSVSIHIIKQKGSDGTLENTYANYTLTLGLRPKTDVTLHFTPDDNWSTIDEPLVFTTDDWNLPHQMSLFAVDDMTKWDSPYISQVTMTLSSDDVAWDSDGDFPEKQFSIVIDDEDIPGINIIKQAQVYLRDEIVEGDISIHEVSLNSRPREDVMLTFRTLDAELSMITLAVNFTRDDWNITQEVHVQSIDNTINTLDETYMVSIEAEASSTDIEFEGMIQQYNLTIEDNDNNDFVRHAILTWSAGTGRTNITFHIEVSVDEADYPTGDTITLTGSQFSFGDETNPLTTLIFDVLSRDSDIVVAEIMIEHTYVEKTDSGKPWEATFSICCRSRLLRNNRGLPVSLTSFVDLTVDSSPIAASPPSIYMEADQSFQIAFTASGFPSYLKIAGPLNYGSAFGAMPFWMELNSFTGLVAVRDDVVIIPGTYSAVFDIIDAQHGISSTVELIFFLREAAANPISWAETSPSQNDALTVAAGSVIELNFSALDLAGDDLANITSGVLPVGATLGISTHAAGQVNATITFAPVSSGEVIICAMISTNGGRTVPPRCVSIIVMESVTAQPTIDLDANTNGLDFTSVAVFNDTTLAASAALADESATLSTASGTVNKLYVTLSGAVDGSPFEFITSANNDNLIQSFFENIYLVRSEATNAAYETILRSLVYHNTKVPATTGERVARIYIYDGVSFNIAAVATVTIGVNPTQPIIDLNGDLSGSGASVISLQTTSSQNIATVDCMVTDGNLGQLTEAIIVLANKPDGDDEILDFDMGTQALIKPSIYFINTPTSELNFGNMNAAFLLDTISVNTVDAALTHIAVVVRILHTWIGDVKLQLIHEGKTVDLTSSPGGSQCDMDNLDRIVFDDDAVAVLEKSSESPGLCEHNTHGTFKPIMPLSMFDGLRLDGDWTLVATDYDLSSDSGSIAEWGLVFSLPPIDRFSFSPSVALMAPLLMDSTIDSYVDVKEVKGEGKITSLSLNLHLVTQDPFALSHQLSDLQVVLESPLGTSVVVIDELTYCNSGTHDFIYTELVDSAVGNLTDLCGNGFLGTAQPTNALSAFNGEDPTGCWKLHINWEAGTGGGRLHGWRLNFANIPNVAGSWDLSENTLTLSGSDTPAMYAVALQNSFYINNNVAPTNGIERTVSVTVTDGTSTSNAAVYRHSWHQSTVYLDSDEEVGGTRLFTENDGSILLFPSLIFSDSEFTEAEYTFVVSTNTYVDAEETLTATTGSTGIEISLIQNANNMSLTLSSPSSTAVLVSDFQAVLRTITWVNSVEEPSNSTRSFTLTGSDGRHASNDVVVVINVELVNDFPVLDLNGLASDINMLLEYAEKDGAINLVNADNLTISDNDNSHMDSAVVTFVDAADGDVETLSVDVGNTNVVALFSGTTLTLNGTDTINNYEVVLRTVRYEKAFNAGVPDLTARVFSFIVNDGEDDSLVATSTVTFDGVNDIPVLDLNGDSAGYDHVVAFTENGGPVAVVDSDGLTLLDIDHSTLASVAISLGVVETTVTDEILAYDLNLYGNVGNYNSSSGILLISGSELVSTSDFEAVLRTITYENLNSEPDNRDRNITFVANDGSDYGVTRTTTVVMDMVNDAPVLVVSSLSGTEIATEDEDTTDPAGVLLSDVITMAAESATDVDVDDTLGVAVIFVDNTNGSWMYSITAGVSWSTFDDVSSESAYALYMTDKVRFVPSADFFGTSELRLVLWDAASTGDSGSTVNATYINSSSMFSQDEMTIYYTINPVNDAPIISLETLTATFTEETASVPAVVNILLTDIDDVNLSSATVELSPVFDGENEFLECDEMLYGSVCNYSNDILTVSGLASLAEYQDMLESVSYTNTAVEPDSSNRTLVFTLIDESLLESTSVTVVLSIEFLNDSPIFTTNQMNVAVNEDVTSGENDGWTLTTVTDSIYSDEDTISSPGIVVALADVNNGVWQYLTLTTGSWTDIPNVSENNAFLLGAEVGTQLRFTPAQDFFGTADAILYPWDGSNGGETGDVLDISSLLVDSRSSVGSTATTFTYTVVAVNDAPLVSMGETNPYNVDYSEQGSASLVGDIDSMSLSDVDNDPVMNVTVFISNIQDTGLETLSYDVNVLGAVGSYDITSGILTFSNLNSNNDFLSVLKTVRYANAATEPQGTDRTVITTVTDSLGATGTWTTFIDSLVYNDSPVFVVTTDIYATAIDEDTTTIVGDSLTSMIPDSDITDEDDSPIKGIALFDADNTNGIWRYSTDSGSTWIDIPSGERETAVVLRLLSTIFLSFLPSPDFFGMSEVCVVSWDTYDSSTNLYDVNQDGDIINATEIDHRDAFSSTKRIIIATINAVNDVPVVDLDTTSSDSTFYAIFEEQGQSIYVQSNDNFSVVDVDNDNLVYAQVHLTNIIDFLQESLDYNRDLHGAVGTYYAFTGILLIEGLDLITEYSEVLSSVTYKNSAVEPDFSDRIIEFTLNDGTGDSNVRTTIVSKYALNDSPVLNITALTFSPHQDEDSVVNFLVSDLLVNAVTDEDTGALEGIAIFELDSLHGIWAYSLASDSESFVDITSITDGFYFLLGDDAFLRFSPDGDWHGTTSVSFVAWDQTQGVEATEYSILAEQDDRDPFSVASVTLAFIIDPINDAPIISTTSKFISDVLEDDFASSGMLVSHFISSSSFNGIIDVDAELGDVEHGVAIYYATSMEAYHGEWQYSLNDGDTWLSIDNSTSVTAAVVLNDAAYLRFVPDLDFNGVSEITMHAWDLTDGFSSGERDIDVSSEDNVTGAFSQASTLAVTVNPQNDAPEILESLNLLAIDEDNVNSAGSLVSSVIGDAYSDVDLSDVGTNDTLGIAVITVDFSNGYWEYFNVNDNIWHKIVGEIVEISDGTIVELPPSPMRGTLLTGEDRVRFVPNLNFNGYATMVWVAWDSSSEVRYSETIDTTAPHINANGASIAAFGTSTQQVTLKVNSVPDSAVFQLTSSSRNYSTSVAEEDSSGVAIVDAEGMVLDDDDYDTVLDTGTDFFVSVTITIENAHDTWSEWVNVTIPEDSSFNVTILDPVDGTRAVVISTQEGDALELFQNYATVLKTTRYYNLEDEPNLDTRIIQFLANDGSAISIAHAIVEIISVNDKVPVVVLWDDTAIPVIFTEDSGIEGIVLPCDNDVFSLTDIDDNAIFKMEEAVLWLTTDNVDVDVTDGEFLVPTEVSNSVNISGTNPLVIKGLATVSEYSALIRSVGYYNLDDEPTAAFRIMHVLVTDEGGLQSTESTVYIDLQLVNEKHPTVSDENVTVSLPRNLTLNEGSLFGDGVALFEHLVVADGDGSLAEMSRAYVTIDPVLDGDEESLRWEGNEAVSANYDSQTYTMTIEGPGSVEIFTDVLRGVTYYNTAEEPTATSLRSVTAVVVDDGDLVTITPYETRVQIIRINDAPLLRFTGDLSRIYIDMLYIVNYIENDEPTPIAPELALRDYDSEELTSATIRFIPYEGEPARPMGDFDIIGGDDSDAITTTYEDGLLSLSGTASVAEYETLLKTVYYFSSSEDPITTPRMLEWNVTDSSGKTSTNFNVVTFDAVNDAPFVEMDDTLVYVESSGMQELLLLNETPLKLPLQLQDVDDFTLQSASVLIRGGVEAYSQFEYFSWNMSYPATYDREAGILTFSGLETVSSYAEAIMSVRYANDYDEPPRSTVYIDFIFNDGISSTLVSLNVVIEYVNDKPTIISSQDNEISVMERDVVTLFPGTITIGDPEARNETAYLAGVRVEISALNGTVDTFLDDNVINLEGGVHVGHIWSRMGNFSASTLQNILGALTFHTVGLNPDISLIRFVSVFVIDHEGLDSEPLVLGIRIIPVNDPPTSRCENGLPCFSILNLNEDEPYTAVLTDMWEDPETILSPEDMLFEYSNPELGRFVGNDNGTFSWMPALDMFGSTVATLHVCDSLELCTKWKVTINVAPLNDPPKLAPSMIARVDEDHIATFKLSDYYYDVEDGDIAGSVTITRLPVEGSASVDMESQVVIYTPKENWVGSDSLIFSVGDTNGEFSEAEITIMVVEVNDIPILLDSSIFTQEDISATIFPTMSDIEDSSTFLFASLNVTKLPSNGTAEVDNLTSMIKYTPYPHFHGDDMFVYEICDSGSGLEPACVNATAEVTVQPLNDAPLFLVDELLGFEDTELKVLIKSIIVDIEEGILGPDAVEIISGPSFGVASIVVKLPTSVDTLTENGEDAGGNVSEPSDEGEQAVTKVATLYYLGNKNHNGFDSIEFRACDSIGLCSEKTLDIVLTPVNDEPLAPDVTVIVPEDTLGMINLAEISLDVEDGHVKPSDVVIEVMPLPSDGVTLYNSTTGWLTFKPSTNFWGEVSVSYGVRDSKNMPQMGVVIFDVQSVNDIPWAYNFTSMVFEDEHNLVLAFPHYGDADTDAKLHVEVTHGPFKGAVTVSQKHGIILYKPISNYVGPDLMQYTVCDQFDSCSSAFVTLNVTDVNDPPVTIDIFGQTPINTTAIFFRPLLTTTDIDNILDTVDEDIDPSSVSIVTPGVGSTYIVTAQDVEHQQNGTLDNTTGIFHQDMQEGDLIYIPKANYYGYDDIVFQVCDVRKECGKAILTVRVTIPGPEIDFIVATPALDKDGIDTDFFYGPGDQLHIYFKEPTSMPPEGALLIGVRLAYFQVNRIFEFSSSLGNDYNGVWVNASYFVITCIDEDEPRVNPSLDSFFLSVKPTGNLLNFDGDSLPSEDVSPFLYGSWGTRPIRVAEVKLSNEDNDVTQLKEGSELGAVLSPPVPHYMLEEFCRQQITDILDLSNVAENLDMSEVICEAVYPNEDQIDEITSASGGINGIFRSYYLRRDVNSTNATDVDSLVEDLGPRNISIKPIATEVKSKIKKIEGNVIGSDLNSLADAIKANPNSVEIPNQNATLVKEQQLKVQDIVDALPTVLVVVRTLTGPSIISVVASGGGEELSSLSLGDEITITFNQDTDEPTVDTRELVNGVVEFSHNFAELDYIGSWRTPSQLVIEIVGVPSDFVEPLLSPVGFTGGLSVSLTQTERFDPCSGNDICGVHTNSIGVCNPSQTSCRAVALNVNVDGDWGEDGSGGFKAWWIIVPVVIVVFAISGFVFKRGHIGSWYFRDTGKGKIGTMPSASAPWSQPPAMKTMRANPDPFSTIPTLGTNTTTSYDSNGGALAGLLPSSGPPSGVPGIPGVPPFVPRAVPTLPPAAPEMSTPSAANMMRPANVAPSIPMAMPSLSDDTRNDMGNLPPVRGVPLTAHPSSGVPPFAGATMPSGIIENNLPPATLRPKMALPPLVNRSKNTVLPTNTTLPGMGTGRAMIQRPMPTRPFPTSNQN